MPASRPTGFATRDDAYEVMLSLHHNAEHRAVSTAALFSAAPTAADDDDFLDFSHDDIFFSSTFSFSNITMTIALCMIYNYRSADSTMTSRLLGDTAYLSFS